MTLPEALRALPPEQKLPLEELKEMQRRRDEMTANPSIANDSAELWRRVNEP